MSDDPTTREFHGPKELMSIANDPALHADDKPVFIPRDGDVDPDDESALFYEDREQNVRQMDVSADYKAIYNPQGGQVFGVVTDEYEVVNPPRFIGPLVKELREREREDITGAVRVFDGGARCFATVLFEETHNIWLPNRGRSDPVRCGFTVRWSHDSGLAVKVQGFAQDTACKNSIREITSPVSVKHAGDVEARVNWRDEWADVIDQLGAFSEALAGMIEDAMSFTFFDAEDPIYDSEWREVTDPLNTLEATSPPGPLTAEDRDGMYAFYELLGLPSYLGTAATERLMSRAAQKDDPRKLSAWDTYSAATWALTHHFRGAVGNTDDGKFRTVNDILTNPKLAIVRARDELQARTTDDESLTVVGPEDAERGGEETTGDALRTFSERERALRTSLGGE